MKIKWKLFLVNVILVTALFISLTALLLERSTDAIFKHVKENASVTLSQITQNLDHRLAAYEQIANTMYLNVRLQDALLRYYPNYREAYGAYFEILQPFVSTVRTTQDIRNILFYTPNPTFVFSNVSYLGESRDQGPPWLYEMIDGREDSRWTSSGTMQFPHHDAVFSLKQRLNYADARTALAVSIEVSKQVLYNLVNEESKGKRIVIALPSGDVLLDTLEARASALLHDYPFAAGVPEAAAARRVGEFEYEEGGERFIVFHRTIESRNSVRGMQVIMLVSVEDLLPEIRKTRDLALLLLGASCAVAALLIYLFSSGMMRRLTELAGRMRDVQRNDDFSAQIEVRGRDEISQLGSIFNRMMRHLNELIHEVYAGKFARKEMELRLKESELYALQAQVRPHFLFNVLNSIRGNLLERGDVKNGEIVGLLARSFRLLLRSRGPVAALREECELVAAYLRIQEYRFGGRLAFSLDIPPALLDEPVPTMSLQPLVENAVAHVTERRPEPTAIRITASRDGTLLRIAVEDDGPGIAAERLAEVRGWLADEGFEPREAHYGLWNVHRRLAEMFGPRSGIELESGPGGTRVTIVIEPAEADRGAEAAGDDDGDRS